jgi:hypothetical protein
MTWRAGGVERGGVWGEGRLGWVREVGEQAWCRGGCVALQWGAPEQQAKRH